MEMMLVERKKNVLKEKALQLGRGRVLNVRGSCKEMCLTDRV